MFFRSLGSAGGLTAPLRTGSFDDRGTPDGLGIADLLCEFSISSPGVVLVQFQGGSLALLKYRNAWFDKLQRFAFFNKESIVRRIVFAINLIPSAIY